MTGNIDEIEKDEDRKAVKKMFEWLFKVVEQELGPDLQVIVTDHADIEEDWYQSAIADEKWRGDIALILNIGIRKSNFQCRFAIFGSNMCVL